MKCKYETSNGRCRLKGSYAYRHKCFTTDLCKCHEPVTNADRIRAMSDEELGRFLAAVENRRSAAGGGAIWKGAAHAIEWLKQPAEEET